MSDAVIIALAIPVAGMLSALVKSYFDFALKRRMQVHEAAALDADTIDVMRASIKDMQRDISSLQADVNELNKALRASEERGDHFQKLAEQRLAKFDGFPARISTLIKALKKAGVEVPEDTDTDAGKLNAQGE